jgi:hypothetical protein
MSRLILDLNQDQIRWLASFYINPTQDVDPTSDFIAIHDVKQSLLELGILEPCAEGVKLTELGVQTASQICTDLMTADNGTFTQIMAGGFSAVDRGTN